MHETVNTYDIGDGVTLLADFSSDDQPADPSSVVCKVRRPRSSEAIVVSTTRVGEVTGDDGNQYIRYTADLVVDAEGDWYYRFEGAGTVTAAGEQRFYARRSKVL